MFQLKLEETVLWRSANFSIERDVLMAVIQAQIKGR
jgi:hypothetical protein